MADKAKLLKIAQKHLSKGNLDKAVVTFQQLVEIDPRDQRLLLRLAELQARAGRKKEAIKSYEKIADEYIRQDFTPKAIAVYKTILRLDPELLSAYEKLTELYKSQGLEAEALSQLENLFVFYEKKGDEAKQIEVLNLMVEMDPENLGFQVRLGEMLARKGMKKEAAEAFAKAATTLSRRGFHDRASHLFEKIIGLNPDNIAVRKELCAHYLESGQFLEAQREIEAILKLEPDDSRMVLLLGRILFQLGKKGEAEEKIAQSIKLFFDSGELGNVLKEFLFVAQSHLRNGEVDEAEAFYRQIKEASPSEDRAIKGLVSVAEARNDRGARIKNLALLGRVLKNKGDEKGALKAFKEVHGLDPLHEEAKSFLDDQDQSYEAGSGQELPGPQGDEDVTGLEDVSGIEGVELLSEEVFELGEDTEEFVEILNPEEDEGIEIEDLEKLDIEELEPSEAEAEGESELPDIILEDFSDGVEVSLEDTLEEGFAPADTVEEEDLSVDDLLAEAEVYRRYGLQEKLTETLRQLRSLAADDPVILERVRGFDEEVESQVEPDEALELTDTLGETMVEMEPEDPTAFVKDAAGADREEVEKRDGSEPFQEDLEEAEFYLSQGLEEEARRIYQSILIQSPGHPAALQALSMPEAETSPPLNSSPPADPGKIARDPVVLDPAVGGIRSKLVVEDSISEDAGGFLDLADELRTELSGEFESPAEWDHEDAPVTFEEVFAQFKKGIEETLGEEEYETHYNLGIAYKDMGLFDDALREFEVGLRDPDLAQDSLSLMAMCFMEKKDFDSAVKVVKKALDGSPEASKAGLFYQLGEAFERKKDWKEALSAYSEVQLRDPSFRGIGDLLDRVRSMAGHEVPEEETATSLEGGMDDMLTDLIREVEEMAKESSGEAGDLSEDDPGKGRKDRISYL